MWRVVVAEKSGDKYYEFSGANGRRKLYVVDNNQETSNEKFKGRIEKERSVLMSALLLTFLIIIQETYFYYLQLISKSN